MKLMSSLKRKFLCSDAKKIGFMKFRRLWNKFPHNDLSFQRVQWVLQRLVDPLF